MGQAMALQLVKNSTEMFRDVVIGEDVRAPVSNVVMIKCARIILPSLPCGPGKRERLNSIVEHDPLRIPTLPT